MTRHKVGQALQEPRLTPQAAGILFLARSVQGTDASRQVRIPDHRVRKERHLTGTPADLVCDLVHKSHVRVQHPVRPPRRAAGA
jgi:hypothetical protein